MIADSRLVLSPPSASSSNGQVFWHLVWSNLRALRTLKSSKKWKIIPAKVVGSKITRKQKHISRVTKKIENQFLEEIYRFTNHGKNKSSFTFHAKSRKKYRGPSNLYHFYFNKNAFQWFEHSLLTEITFECGIIHSSCAEQRGFISPFWWSWHDNFLVIPFLPCLYRSGMKWRLSPGFSLFQVFR